MSESTQPSAVDLVYAAAIEKAPLPSTRDLSRRSGLIRQLIRFMILNLKILRLSWSGHGG